MAWTNSIKLYNILRELKQYESFSNSKASNKIIKNPERRQKVHFYDKIMDD